MGTAVVFGAEDEDAFQIIFAINYTVHYLEHLHRTKMLFSVNSHRSLSALVKEYRCGNLDEQYFESNEFSMNGFNMGESEKLRAEKVRTHNCAFLSDLLAGIAIARYSLGSFSNKITPHSFKQA